MKEKNLNQKDLNNICLDTDIIINSLKSKEFGKKLLKLKKQGVSLHTTTINTFELFKGVREKERESLENFFSGLKILDFDIKASEKASQIFNNLKKQGNNLDLADIMIASIAIVNNQALLTENKKHFKRIPELTLV
jgi:tRNA(fMet)-specific endonuclease VapC